jgi:hypothetical protein
MALHLDLTHAERNLNSHQTRNASTSFPPETGSSGGREGRSRKVDDVGMWKDTIMHHQSLNPPRGGLT